MGYLLNIQIDEFELDFGDIGFAKYFGPGVWLNFEDPTIEEAIKNKSQNLLDALFKLYQQKDEIQALHMMDEFERYHLQGHGWRALIDNYDYPAQQNFHKQALLVVNSQRADASQIKTANTIIGVLDGTYKLPPPPEKSPQEKALASFQRKKTKLKVKLVIRDTYKCKYCGKNDEDSLCVIKKDRDNESYELDNLILSCRRCINMNRKK